MFSLMPRHCIKFSANKKIPSIRGNNILVHRLLTMNKKDRLLSKLQSQYLLIVPLPVWWI